MRNKQNNNKPSKHKIQEEEDCHMAPVTSLAEASLGWHGSLVVGRNRPGHFPSTRLEHTSLYWWDKQEESRKKKTQKSTRQEDKQQAFFLPNTGNPAPQSQRVLSVFLLLP